MARLASIARAGFYPTPESVYKALANYAEPQPGARLLDPCCGDGGPASTIAKALELESYGIEIDENRARASKLFIGRVLNLDIEAVKVAKHSIQVLFLNPPYDYDEGEARRLEFKFLKIATPWLAPKGLLFFIIPQGRLDLKMGKYLTTKFTNIKALRFPDPEYSAFKQIVVIGTKRNTFIQDEGAAVELVFKIKSELPALEPDLLEKYTIPPIDRQAKWYFRGLELDPQLALEEAKRSGVWHSKEWHKWLEPNEDLNLRPLMPLKIGHLAQLIAAGLLQNMLMERDGKKLLVKGRTYKVIKKVESNNPNEEIERDQFVTEITTLDLVTGEVAKLETPETLSAFIEEWKQELAATVMARFRPSYNFDYAQDQVQTMILGWLGTEKRLAGRQATGLFEAQKHVASAIRARLMESDSAIVVGEMGVGKSIISASVAALLGQKANPAIITCPSHLVQKWGREIEEALPGSFTMVLRRLSDVETFVREFKRRDGVQSFAIMSKEMAKLGGGWRPAYLTKKVRGECPDGYKLNAEESAEYNNGPEYTKWSYHKLREWQQAKMEEIFKRHAPIAYLFQCPHCGEIIKEKDAAVTKASWFEKKRACESCREPLWQLTHLNGAQNNGNGDVRLRYPIASYIRHHYSGFFKLLIGDEIHQAKGQSTDQGYAFGDLVKACTKTLALTGTIYGGRATSIFYILHRLNPWVRERFGWRDGQAWAERYGVIERVTKYEEGDGGVGYWSARRRSHTYVREIPGVSPELSMILLDCTAFLSLADLGFELPPYEEEPHLLDMEPDMREAYDQLKHDIEGEMQARLAMGDRSLLSAYLQATLGYPNACFRKEEVHDSHGKLIAEAPSLLENEEDKRVFAKENWLVELCVAQKKQGRRTLVFCRQTATRDITQRLKAILQRRGLRTIVLTASVGTEKREEWVANKVKAGLDVMITNPKLVETGLDLVAFQTTAFYELDYSVYTMEQAARRTWRLGQIHPVQVHFAVYKNTMEHRAMALIASKWAAAQLLNGDAVEGALMTGMDNSGSMLAELAQNALAGADIADLKTLFRLKSNEKKEASEFLTEMPMPVPFATIPMPARSGLEQGGPVEHVLIHQAIRVSMCM